MENTYIAQASDLTAVADAIREKGETGEQLVFPDGFVAAIQAIEAGKPVAAMPTFTYSVSGGYETETNEETGEWKIRFLKSGKLKFTSEPPKIDIWMTGGGGGTAAHDGSGVPSGGGGYISAKMKYQPEINTEYTITIGAGGSAGYGGDGGRGGTSSAFGVSAVGGFGGQYASGYGGDGASGGNGYMSSAAGATDGADGTAGSGGFSGGKGLRLTTREFFEENGILHSSGGATNSSGKAGAANTGDGGGKYKSGGAGNGNAGGSGIVIIRGSAV